MAARTVVGTFSAELPEADSYEVSVGPEYDAGITDPKVMSSDALAAAGNVWEFEAYQLSSAPTVQPVVGGGTDGSDCDPNYYGPCLKVGASDYDCLGGGGVGPYYTGPVEVCR